MNKVCIPKLRFSRFEGEWEVNELGNTIGLLTDYHANGSYEKLKENVQLLEDKEYAVMIRTTNFEKKDFQNNLLYINENAYNFLKKSKVQPNDIIINKIANAGATYLMPNLNRPVSLAMNLFLLRVKKEYSSRFLFYQIKTKEHLLRALASGTGTKTITKLDVRNFKLDIPSLLEQQKIASFLSSVDEKIQQLSRKKELLEQYKKGVMQQLFSRKLRFKDENGEDYPDWEEKKLGDIGKFYAGGDLDKLNYSKIKSNEFTYPIYANGSGEGIYGYATTFQYKKNSVTVSGRGNLGYANFRTQNFNAIVRLIVIEPKDFISPKYLEEIINQTKFAIESTGVPQLTVPQIKSYKISFPSLPEQQKIANFLSGVDNKIENAHQEINNMQGFKKGLLQQMFV